MSTTLNIPKSPELKKGEDFYFLREEGIKLIQQYSGTTWTDHNIHDPGITILEIFCFALTELSLKANLDIKDLLASSLSNPDQTLFTPEEILPAHPITTNDYRKILINTPGVRNGWFIPLSLGETNNINGLYNILLEFDKHPTLGDINSSLIVRLFSIDYGGGDIRNYIIEISFPFWDEEFIADFQEIVVINAITSPAQPNIVLTNTSSEDLHDYYADLEITYNGGTTTSFGITIIVRPDIGADPVENTAVENEIIALLGELPGDNLTDNPILTNFNEKVTAAAAIESQVREKLYGLRNLGEDINEIKAVRIQEISMNARIDLLKPMNIEKYLANILFELETFFRPIIKYSSLQEMENEGISYENIFDGPLLDNGFLNDDILENTPGENQNIRNNVVFVSDLLNLLIKASYQSTSMPVKMAEEQIVAVSLLNISNFIRNIAVVQKASDCLILAKPELYKPRFSFNKSNITFFRNNVELSYNENLVNLLLEELRTSAESSNSYSNTTLVPVGDTLLLNDFYSIQNDFPSTYGLGKNILSESHPLQKRAKVEQFRSYLTPLDQLLAGYSNQLNHINDLFSINIDLQNTYFKSPLYNIPYYNKILLSFINSGLTWENFQNDLNNNYQQKLDDLVENKALFSDRRNRFLDHLMARFGISIEKYISYRYEENTIKTDDLDELELRQQEIAFDLISDKINYLKNFKELSKNRYKALNYNVTAWDTLNTSGLAKRLLTQMGLRNLNRRSFYNEVLSFIQINSVGPNFTYSILDESMNPILESVNNYANVLLAQDAARQTIINGINRDNYFVESEVILGGSPLVVFQPDATSLPSFEATAITPEETIFDARVKIRNVIRNLKEIGSGVYIIEHILLRPDPNLPSTIDMEIYVDEELIPDPYSMRISIIFPSGFEKDFILNTDPIPSIPSQFQNENFRNYLTRIIKEEIPAHILPYVFWLDYNVVADSANTPSLNNLTETWRAWLEAKENPLTTPLSLQNRRDELITVLNNIHLTSL